MTVDNSNVKLTLQDWKTTRITVLLTLHNKVSSHLSSSCHSCMHSTQHNTTLTSANTTKQPRNRRSCENTFSYINSHKKLQWWGHYFMNRRSTCHCDTHITKSLWITALDYIADMLELWWLQRVPIWLRSQGFVTNLGNSSATANSTLLLTQQRLRWRITGPEKDKKLWFKIAFFFSWQKWQLFFR